MKPTDIEKACAALTKLDPTYADDRELWLKVGMALHSVGDDLLLEWDEWSKQSEKYRPGECQKQWRGFNGSGGVGLGTLIHMAGGNGSAHTPAKPKVAPSNKPGYPSLDEAVRAAERTTGGKHFQAWVYPGGTFAIVRLEPKDFRPFHLNGSSWAVGDPTGQLPLYRSDELSGATRIYICEGERCVDAACSIGLTAVTSAHGSSSAKRSDWTPLAGRDVVILPDCDAPGRKYSDTVAGILSNLNPPASVRILSLPGLPEHGDIVEFIDERDSRTNEEIQAEIESLADAAPTTQTEMEDVGQPGLLPGSIDVSEFLAKYLPMEDAIINTLLRRGETATLVSASKARKSWTALDLCVAVATGGMWFDLQCRPGRTLLLDCELQPATLQHRLSAVLQAKGIVTKDIRDRFQVACWRGEIITLEGLAGYLDGIKPGQFDLIVADPIYKLYPRDFDENDNTKMAQLFGTFQTLAERVKAALLIVCHTPKGDVSSRSTVDLIAGAGSAGRAVDVAIALRQHAASEPGAPVIVRETIARSFAELPPLCFRWEHPRWIAAPNFDPHDLKRSGGRQKKTKVEDDPPEQNAESFVRAVFTDEQPQTKGTILAQGKGLGMSRRASEQLLGIAESQNLVFRHDFGPKRPIQFATIPQDKLINDTDK